jgi:hypothetical protein
VNRTERVVLTAAGGLAFSLSCVLVQYGEAFGIALAGCVGAIAGLFAIVAAGLGGRD